MIFKVGGWATTLALLAAAGAGCGSSSNGTKSGAGGKGGAGGAGGETLYGKYGAAIPKVVDDAVAGVLADCEISPYFAVVGTTGHDSVARLKSCLRLQFTALMGGPATYPGKNDEGDTCVDMTAIHAGLGIPGPVFDKFATDLAGVLSADGVAADDVTTIAGAVTGLKTQIVSAAPVEKSACDAGAGGAGGAAGAGGAGGSSDAGMATLYSKYGTAIPKVVDDAVAGVLADCEISPYFAVVGTTGHDSVARLKSCLRLQFTALMGGPATYPGKNDEGDTCLDMTAIHAGLGIPGPVFDKFATDLAGVLSTDGVAADDVTTIAGAVTGLKTQVVSATPVEKTACDAGAGDGGNG